MNEREAARRRRVLHGWVFRNHTVAETVAIKQYLDRAEADSLDDLPEAYKRVDKVVLLSDIKLPRIKERKDE